MTRRRMVTALSALLVLVSAGAVAAKVAFDRYFLVHDGKTIGTVEVTHDAGTTTLGIDGKNLPASGTVEIRSESGNTVGTVHRDSGGNTTVTVDGAAH